jgi:putative PIN family toxin of toxin-antitoxin system
LKVVLDTNIIVAALRSRTGASFRLLELAGRRELALILSIPSLDEYEEVIQRPEHRRIHRLSSREGRRFLHGVIAAGEVLEISDHGLVLSRDPDDLLVAEAALQGAADHLVTHNVRHFGELASHISVVTPGALLRIMSS